MSEIEKIVNDVDSSMSMEGLPLTNEDKDRIKICLTDPTLVDRMISDLLAKHTVSAKV